MALGELVVTANRRDLVYTIYDPLTGNPVNLTGGTARLQGRSLDTPAVTIDSAMSLLDAANGVVTYVGLGALISAANLTAASVKRTTYKLRVKFTDSGAEFDWSPIFEIIWSADPTAAL